MKKTTQASEAIQDKQTNPSKPCVSSGQNGLSNPTDSDDQAVPGKTPPAEVITYKSVFTQKEYVRLMTANLISRFGDSIDMIAFTWLVYAATGSAAWSAVIFAVNQLPTILVQSFAGALVERMDKKKIMVVTDFIRGAVTSCLAVLFIMGKVNPWILLLLTFLNSSAEAFCMPAGMAVIPQLIEEKYYAYGTSLYSTVSTVVQLIGIGAAGVIIGAFGAGAAIFIDGFSFFGSALILSFLKVKKERKTTEKPTVKGYFADLKGGIGYLTGQPVVRNFCIMGIVLNALVVPLNSLQTPLVVEVLGQGSGLLSVLSFVMMAGMGIGSLCFPLFSQKYGVRFLMVVCGFGIGISFYLFTLGEAIRDKKIGIYVLTAAVSAVIGMAVSIMAGVLNVQFMKTVEQEYLARAGSIFNACACAAAPVMSFIISGAAGMLSVSEIFRISAVLCVIMYLFIAVKRVRFE